MLKTVSPILRLHVPTTLGMLIKGLQGVAIKAPEVWWLGLPGVCTGLGFEEEGVYIVCPRMVVRVGQLWSSPNPRFSYLCSLHGI